MRLKSQRNVGMFVLAIWLIANGLRQAISLSLFGLDFAAGILELIAGAVLYLGWRFPSLRRR